MFGWFGLTKGLEEIVEEMRRELKNVFNSNHFRFCVGDRFFLCDNKILCEYDYEERMVFANLAYNSSNLAHIKQQASRAGKVS